MRKQPPLTSPSPDLRRAVDRQATILSDKQERQARQAGQRGTHRQVANRNGYLGWSISGTLSDSGSFAGETGYTPVQPDDAYHETGPYGVYFRDLYSVDIKLVGSFEVSGLTNCVVNAGYLAGYGRMFDSDNDILLGPVTTALDYVAQDSGLFSIATSGAQVFTSTKPNYQPIEVQRLDGEAFAYSIGAYFGLSITAAGPGSYSCNYQASGQIQWSVDF